MCIGQRILAQYTYSARNNFLERLDYGNGDRVQYEYDKQGRVTSQTYEDGDTVTYRYDNNGALASVTDSATGRTTTYYYDFTNRLMKYMETGDVSHSVQYTYDDQNKLTDLVEVINGVTHTTHYTYDDDQRLTQMIHDAVTIGYTYDSYNRLSRKDIGVTGYTYTYRTSNGSPTGQVSQLTLLLNNANGISFNYTYDDNGNILSFTELGYTTSYVYDSANQLVRENNQLKNKTWVWTYDNAGNILSKTEYAYTTGTLGEPLDTIVYTYGDSAWGDLLTAYDGVAITYDEMGNPLNDGTWTYTWEHGRQLASMAKSGTTWTYTYDANGMRTSRSNGTDTYTYVYNGGQLVQMTVGTHTLYFTYDAGGTPATVTLDGTMYYYITNLQGDVVAIWDETSNYICDYYYDAWGKVITRSYSTNHLIDDLNPLLYRGYVYDHDTNLYYLQSRYYNPTIGRFINADIYTSTGQGILGCNMFAYCRNNPVKRVDALGTDDICITDDNDGNPTDDLMYSAGGGGGSMNGSYSGYAYADNPIDAGYTYYADYSTSLFSSLYTGIYQNGYDFVETYAPSACFVAGTLVQSEEGAVPIEEIAVGDMVWAWDEATGDVALKKVVETYINESDELIHIFVNGEEIITTPTHPFYSPVKGWTAAAKLRAGDILVLVNGEYVVVEKVQHEILEAPVTVYNFQVEGYHTYYVSNVGVLVHNTCERGVGGKGWKGDQTWRKNVKIVRSGGTITELIGGIPTRFQGEQLIARAGGHDMRVEDGHEPPNPHVYPHINYVVGNKKGTLRITSTEPGGY